jgi:predicted nucleotidyltransferase
MTSNLKIKDSRIINFLSELEERLIEVFNNRLKKVILFGSYAKGNNDNESDIDIMLLVDEKDLKKYDDVILDLTVDLSIKYAILPSIFLENPENFLEYKNYRPLFRDIYEEGIELYAA